MKKYIPLMLLWIAGIFMEAKPEAVVEANDAPVKQQEKNNTGCGARIAIMHCPND